jgi:hypothetical protein
MDSGGKLPRVCRENVERRCEDTAVQELQERRDYLCRLTPNRALDSLDDAVKFLEDRGLVTRTADSALPSLFEACHEEPYAPGGRGFASWPATKYPWYFRLASRPEFHELKVHNGKSILFTEQTLALVDPICRSELARMEREPEWERLLTHLAQAGPSTLDDLQTELGLKPKELKLLRSPLERCGALISRSIRVELADGGHTHTSELLRYDHAYPDPPAEPGGIEELVVSGVRAAVVATEREVARKWFSWRWLFRDGLIEELVSAGRLTRPEPGWLAAPTSA